MDVVVVDDAMIIRLQLRNFFQTDMGFNVAGTGNDGEQAVTLYKKHKPDFITLDLTMPNKDGIDALAEIIDYDPDAKIIVFSAIKDTEKITKALELGALEYIKKPLQLNNQHYMEKLKKTIRETLDL